MDFELKWGLIINPFSKCIIVHYDMMFYLCDEYPALFSHTSVSLSSSHLIWSQVVVHVFFIISSTWYACLLVFISEGMCIWQRAAHLNTHKHAHIHTALFITLIGSTDLAANPQKHLQLGGINIDSSTVSLFLKKLSGRVMNGSLFVLCWVWSEVSQVYLLPPKSTVSQNWCELHIIIFFFLCTSRLSYIN